MKTTIVAVLKRNGDPFVGASVRLGFVDSAANEITPTVRTDNKGVAVIEQKSSGTAEVFVNGRGCGQYELPRMVTIEWAQ